MEVYETGFRPPKQNAGTGWHEYTSRLRPPPTFLGLCASSWTLLAAERRKNLPRCADHLPSHAVTTAFGRVAQLEFKMMCSHIILNCS
jgi:hypothetical protein